MKRKFVFIAAFISVVFATNIAAQKATITFSKKIHDFGEIAENGGNASTVFEFTNTGNTPLIIQRVNASCGCTTPEWTKTPIEPGKKGQITATYNPLGRPGAFSKEIYVYSNASNEMERLTIKGSVTPKPSDIATNPVDATQYSVQMGQLGLDTRTVQFGNIPKANRKTVSIKVKNTSSAPLNITLTHLPTYITAGATPALLQPQQEGVVRFDFDTKHTTEWGPINDYAYIVLNGNRQESEEYKIGLTANVVEDFSQMNISQKREAPILALKSTILHLGKIKKGSKIRGKFTIKNVGINPLEIRRVINNNSDMTITPQRTTIRGGRTEHMLIYVNTQYLPKGDYKKTFTLQTNDPNRSTVIYTAEFSVI